MVRDLFEILLCVTRYKAAGSRRVISGNLLARRLSKVSRSSERDLRPWKRGQTSNPTCLGAQLCTVCDCERYQLHDNKVLGLPVRS